MLLTNLQSLQVVLAGAVATTQPVFCTYWADHTTTTFNADPFTGTANGTTAVNIVAAPAAGTRRQIKEVTLYNADSASVTATIQINDNGTSRPQLVATLLPGQTLQFVDGAGWSSLAASQSPTAAGYIEGLRLVYVGPNALTLESGSAYVQSLARRVDVPSAIAKSSLSLSASSWYHAYLLESAGVADYELSTTAPASAYNGVARSKTGDQSRRYLGSVKTLASGGIAQFIQTGNYIGYLGNINTAPFFVLIGGTATTRTTIDFSGIVPVTSTIANACAQNIDPANKVVMATPDLATLTDTVNQLVVPPSWTSLLPAAFQLSTARELDYRYLSAPSGSFYLAVNGYWYER